jgi:hypothetical protein
MLKNMKLEHKFSAAVIRKEFARERMYAHAGHSGRAV